MKCLAIIMMVLGGVCAILTVVFALCWGINSLIVPLGVAFNVFIACVGVKWYCEVSKMS